MLLVSMDVAAAARLYGWNMLWRVTGARTAGRALIEALGAPDEDLQMLAGIFLVRGAGKSEPLLEEALARRKHLPEVITILADIGDPKYKPEFHRLAEDPDPAVADAARDALRVLEARREAAASN
jgi:hypothetical protein